MLFTDLVNTKIFIDAGHNSEDTLQSTLYEIDTFETYKKGPSFCESNKGSKERQGPTPAVRFTEAPVKRESTVLVHIITKITLIIPND